MPSLWLRLERQVDRTVTGFASEDVLFTPQKAGRRDPDRPALTLRGLLQTGYDQPVTPNGTGIRILDNNEAELRIERRKYPDLRVEVGDTLRAVERVGQPWFRVRNREGLSNSMLSLTLEPL